MPARLSSNSYFGHTKMEKNEKGRVVLASFRGGREPEVEEVEEDIQKVDQRPETGKIQCFPFSIIYASAVIFDRG